MDIQYTLAKYLVIEYSTLVKVLYYWPCMLYWFKSIYVF